MPHHSLVSDLLHVYILMLVTFELVRCRNKHNNFTVHTKAKIVPKNCTRQRKTAHERNNVYKKFSLVGLICPINSTGWSYSPQCSITGWSYSVGPTVFDKFRGEFGKFRGSPRQGR